MSALLETFEKEYSCLTADITVKVGQIPNLSGGEKRSHIHQVERHVDEAKDLLEQMELEIRTLPVSVRPRYQSRLSSYNSELERLKKDFQQARLAFSDESQSRNELLGGEDSRVMEEQRALLQDNSERIEKQTRKLEGGYKVALETEKIGAEILTNLHDQRETIKKARERLRETDDDLGKSSRILSSMVRRVMQNRAILYVIATVMLAVIILSIYFAYQMHS